MATLLYKGVPSNPENGLRVRLGWVLLTLTGSHTMTNQDAQFLGIDAGGASRNVVMPAESASQGSFFYIGNISGSGEDLVFKASNGSDTVGTIVPGDSSFVVCDGTNWNVL